MKRFDKVRIRKYSIGLNKEAMRFAGKEAIVLQSDGEFITIAIDHDNDVSTEPLILTVKSKYIELVSRFWSIWLAIRGLFQ